MLGNGGLVLIDVGRPHTIHDPNNGRKVLASPGVLMLIPLDILKLIQAATVLLKEHTEHRMSRLRLLKLLYIADREYLATKARPITGDNVVAMDHGPVLTTAYDLIKGQDFNARKWQHYLETRGLNVVLIHDPGVGKLSRHEIATLQEVARRFRDDNDWDVAEHTHTFSEWKKNKPPKKSSKAIPLDDILEATKQTARKAALLADQHRRAKADAFFGNTSGA